MCEAEEVDGERYGIRMFPSAFGYSGSKVMMLASI